MIWENCALPERKDDNQNYISYSVTVQYLKCIGMLQDNTDITHNCKRRTNEKHINDAYIFSLELKQKHVVNKLLCNRSFPERTCIIRFIFTKFLCVNNPVFIYILYVTYKINEVTQFHNKLCISFCGHFLLIVCI